MSARYAPNSHSRYGRSAVLERSFGDFRCLACGHLVSAQEIVSGVHNRNHCPYCLWSRHLDLYQAGDRMAACKAGMRPVGLTLKRSRDKYGGPASGELMLVHQCSECGKLSINRIAADDDDQMVLEIFEASLILENSLRREIEEDGIHILSANDLAIVRARLFGWN